MEGNKEEGVLSETETTSKEDSTKEDYSSSKALDIVFDFFINIGEIILLIIKAL